MIGITLALLIAQPADFTIPLVGQPSPFYQLVSHQLKVFASVDRQELTPEDWLTFTIRLEGVLYPQLATVPDLNSLEGFSGFQIETQPKVTSEANVCVFSYRLRPRSVEVQEIPEMTFHYFDPARDKPQVEARRKYGLVRSPAIALTVKPVPKTEPRSPELSFPPYLMAPPTGAELLSQPNDLILERMALILPPILMVAGCVFWYWRYPSFARQVKAKKNRAARIALNQLHKAEVQPDPLTFISAILRNYWADRLGGSSGQLPSTLPEPFSQLVALNQQYHILWNILEQERFRPQHPQHRLDIPAIVAQVENLILGIENS
jgi:hypothetical protein